MDINTVWAGVSAAAGAVMAGGGTALAWMAKHKKTWYPIVEAIGSSPQSKQLVNDLQGAMAAKDSAARSAEIRAALFEGMLVLANPAPELGQAEKWVLQHYLTDKLPLEIQPYVNRQTVEGWLNALPAVINEAQKGEWYQLMQRVKS